MNLPIVPADSSDERQESIVVGAAVALALVVGLGFGAAKVGLLDKFFGDADVTKVAAPVFAWVHTEAGGDPQRVLLSGFVVDEKQSKAIEASVKKAFPKSEVKNAVRIDVPKPGVKKPAKPGTGTVRLSFAADAVNEAWPRARFGQVKRFEVVWKEDQLTVRGALFTPESKAGLEKAFGALNKKNQGVLQVRDVVRPAVPVDELQNQISTAIAGRVVLFDKDGALDGKDATTTAIVSSVAPLLKNLEGLDVWISVGNAARDVSQKQAETLKAALVAGGADSAGLRAVPAAANNPLSLIVREKD